ncbi:MAG: zf-HC2 domain-containing protein [Myxococcota bacterium]
MNEHAEDVLGRDQHLTGLALDRYLYDPPDPARLAAVQAHLATCAPCRTRLQALQSHDASVSWEPRATAAPARQGPFAPASNVVELSRFRR